jgi:hypothetical protein
MGRKRSRKFNTAIFVLISLPGVTDNNDGYYNFFYQRDFSKNNYSSTITELILLFVQFKIYFPICS